MEYDIVVGIWTRNCADLMASNVKIIDQALVRYFPKQSSLILCVDAASQDSTREAFQNATTKAEKKFLVEKGKRGKGSAVKTILQRAKMARAKSLLLLEGNNASLKKETIKDLLTPVAKGRVDFSLPTYVRDKHDLPIDYHLVTPLCNALFQSGLPELLSGDYAMSYDTYTKFLNAKFFPVDDGVNLFLSMSALCEGLKVGQVRLGGKQSLSAKTYARPEESVMPQFNQVMKVFIQLSRYYKTGFMKKIKPEVKKLGKHPASRPKNISITLSAYKELSRNLFDNPKGYVEEVYKQLNKQSIMGLKVAWLNWLSVYFDQVKQGSQGDADTLRSAMMKEFVKQRESVTL